MKILKKIRQTFLKPQLRTIPTQRVRKLLEQAVGGNIPVQKMVEQTDPPNACLYRKPAGHQSETNSNKSENKNKSNVKPFLMHQAQHFSEENNRLKSTFCG